jgi:urocanate hydratase
VVRNIATKAKKKAKEKDNEVVIEGNELQIAQDLIRSGIAPDIIEKYLATKLSNK